MKKHAILSVVFVILSVFLGLAAVLRMGENAVLEQQARADVAQILQTTEPGGWYGAQYCAVLEIGELSLILPVLDHYTEAELKRTPCLYSGSLETEDMVITAHNYMHHFGRLGELAPGSQLTLRTEAGEERCYRLAVIEELSSTDVEAMVHSDWPLTLYTCTFDQRSMLTLRWADMDQK